MATRANGGHAACLALAPAPADAMLLLRLGVLRRMSIDRRDRAALHEGRRVYDARAGMNGFHHLTAVEDL
jgi:hypothetical protein